ncbi:MAG: glycerol-3-phosphate dehydrogenase/oxidase [Cellvibrionaceae bacterium]|nr:glycerol-3-phosphate dehydrogenase/oxidase [Cellvibrionaceae bacterium]
MNLRQSNIQKLQGQTLDVLVLGGGINGAVSAAALSAKGAKVGLIDKRDFAGFTSSNSSNLAWGGIKYLESHEYGLVWKLCKSRNHLMRSYPSTVKEIRFLTTVQKGFRYPPLFVFLGTIVYWFFGRFFTQAPKYLSKKKIGEFEPVINTSNAAGGFEYSDSYLHDNDARFVFNFIRSSMNYGCAAANYVESLNAKRMDGYWRVTAQDKITGDTFTIKAKTLVNACGPYVDKHNEHSGQKTEHSHLFSKGIHLLVDRVTDHKRILAFFASDGRLFFVIPMGPKTCIGTTDTQVATPEVAVTEEDRNFVLKNANMLLSLEKPLTKDDIIAERCGVRPLALEGKSGVADWVKLSRKHAIDIDIDQQHLSIFGGKLTDCINVGNEVAELTQKLGIELPYADKIWYGEASDEVKQEFLHQAKLMNLDAMTSPTSPETLSERLWRRYGDKAIEMLEIIRQDPKKGEVLIEHTEYLRCELEYIAQREMVTKLDDFLSRRSKISFVVRMEDILNAAGLSEASEILFGDQAADKLAEFLKSNGVEPANWALAPGR